jgi:hypothetical protein
VLQSGRDSTSLLVWPGSHHIAANFERYTAACKSKEPNPALSIKDRTTLERNERTLCGNLKPQRILIPPYSALIGRGDLVHAGDESTASEPTVRNHVHCTGSRDKIRNSIFIRPFGN